MPVITKTIVTCDRCNEEVREALPDEKVGEAFKSVLVYNRGLSARLWAARAELRLFDEDDEGLMMPVVYCKKCLVFEMEDLVESMKESLK